MRRCWRFGQKQAVKVHIFASPQEGAVVANLRRKFKLAGADPEAIATLRGQGYRLRGAVALPPDAGT